MSFLERHPGLFFLLGIAVGFVALLLFLLVIVPAR